MSEPVYLLLGALALFGLVFVAGWVAYSRRAAAEPTPAEAQPAGTSVAHVITGFVTNFFDALGIGSFATTTAIFRFFKSVPDRVLPGTLNVGHTLPTIAQAVIFIALIQVDMFTLVSMIIAAVIGAWLGAGVVAKWPRHYVQWGMGIALLAAAAAFTATNMKWFPGGGDDFALTGTRLYIGLAGNFLLGALMSLGIGLYAPCMILVALLGMNPTAAFPIMMGSCAFLMPVASLRFIKEKSYAFRAALGLAIGGVFGSILAGVYVRSLDLATVRWLVIVVVLYAAVTLLRSAMSREPDTARV
ncbi:MAG: sulfite exporter TauE/SafE family protein [Acidobacteriota bacterium]|nr:sulfite exporter TauE/SafE family protein [Acidobacteriota bacterium]